MNNKDYKYIFSKNLNYWMQVRGKTQIDFVNDLDINKSAISSWCNGTRIPKMNTINSLAQYLHIELSDLLEDKSELKQTEQDKISRIPLLSDYKENYDYSLDNFYMHDIITNADIPDNSFGITAKDNSMLPLLDIGDIAIILPEKEFTSGSTYLVINHEISIIRKIIKLNNNLYELQALNPYYPAEKVDKVQIIGRVIRVEMESAFK